jgi:hypothetical protein
MNDSTDQASQLAALQALLSQVSIAGQPNATHGVQQPIAGSGWSQPKAAAIAEISGVSIPISLETPAGKLRVYLSFPAACAGSPEAIMMLVQQLSQAGYPLDTWKPTQKTWGNGGGGGGWGNGGNNNNGWRK